MRCPVAILAASLCAALVQGQVNSFKDDLSALFLGGDGPVWGGTPHAVGTCTPVPGCGRSQSCGG